MRNKILFILAALLLSFAATSCKDNNELEVVVPAIDVTNCDLSIPGQGGEAFVEVAVDGAYDATVDKSWLTCSKEGTKVVLTAQPNESLEARYATLTIKAEDETVKLSIVQLGMKSTGFAPEAIVTGSDAAEFTFPYEYDAMLTASTDADWITLNVTATALNVSIAENTTQATPDNRTREAEITWSLGADHGVLKVTQRNASFMKVDSNWTVEYLGVNDYEGEDAEFIQNTVADPTLSGSYAITLFAKDALDASGMAIEDYVSDELAPMFIEDAEYLIELYAMFGYDLTFADFLYEDTDYEIFDIFDPGQYYGVAIGFKEDETLTGHYAYTEFTKEGGNDNPGGATGYEAWLGEWTNSQNDTWTISAKEKDKTYSITGWEGITNAPIEAEYVASSQSLVVRAQEELGTYETQKYGTVSLGVYGLIASGNFYTPGAEPYIIFTAKMASDGASADLNPGTISTSDNGDVTWASTRYIGTADDGTYVGITSRATPLPSKITKKGGDNGGGDDGGNASEAFKKFLGGWTVTPPNSSADAWTTTIATAVADKSYTAKAWQGWTDDWMMPAKADFSNGNIVFKGGTGEPAATNVSIGDDNDPFDIYYMSSCVIDGKSYVITSGTSMYDACQGKLDSNGNIILTGLDVSLSDGGTYTFIDYGIVAMDSATGGNNAIYTFQNEAGEFPVTMKKAGSGSSNSLKSLSLKNAVKVDPSHVINIATLQQNVEVLHPSKGVVISTSVKKHIAK
ncbi:MAG: hypothetical protein MJZ16_03550 [Bacteroidales bacterium]|nr:hypothetical protein [Bacteroidales bacterium]